MPLFCLPFALGFITLGALCSFTRYVFKPCPAVEARVHVRVCSCSCSCVLVLATY